MTDTIFALSSGSPPAAIAIVRVSGPLAALAIKHLAGTLPAPRQASLRSLRDTDGELLDRGIVLWFPGPHTATGEDLAEFQVHGGRAVVAAVTTAIGKLGGCRPAEPGEFTRRALGNGIMDLTEAEGLADLLQAETEIQRRSAMAVAGGAISRLIERWQADLLEASALVESLLDFSDEGDVTVDEERPRKIAGRLREEIGEYLRAPSAERLRDGATVVLAGPPNSGKSTLFNRLLGRDAAIVTDIAGTTRDAIEVPTTIDGIPVRLTDTAGLRETEDMVERMGVDRAKQIIAAADLVLWLGNARDTPRPDAIKLSAKCDIATVQEGSDLSVSALTGVGIADLRQVIKMRTIDAFPNADQFAFTTRQHDLLREAHRALGDHMHHDLLLVAEGFRLARYACDRLTGRVGTEDMLAVIFNRFCVGK